MKYDTIKFSPWGDLLIDRYREQQKQENICIKTELDLDRRLRQSRKALLGTGRSLSILISEDGKPDEVAIDSLCIWLTAYANAFAESENEFDYEGFFEHFFRFGLYIYSEDDIQDECVDDLILLANCYATNGPRIYWYVVHSLLPEHITDEFDEWMNVDTEGYGCSEEYPQAPRLLERHVTAAVAALLGTMREPSNI